MANASAGNAYIPGGGGGGVGIAVGGNTQTSGTVVFSNSNGVTFGYNNGTITATVTPGPAAGIAAVAAGTQTATSGTQVFSNSNNVSFGMSGSTQITASANPGVSALSAGTTSVVAGAVVLSNSNGLSFGLNGSTITGSYTVPGQAFSASGGSSTFSTLSFANSNGITFSNSAGSVVASYNSTSAAGQGTTFAGTNISASITLNTAGLNLALSGAAGGGGSPNISAGTTSGNLGSVVFSNSNGVSFGLNGSTITGSVVAQTNQSIGVYGVSQTTGQSSSSTYDARSLSFAGYGVISIGQSGGTVQISGPATTAFAGISVSAGTTSNGLSSVVFSNSNGVSFGLNGSTVTGSVATSLTNINVSAGTTSNNLSALTFSNSNGVSFGLNGSVITASAAAGGGAALSAGTQSTNGNTVVFSNSNNVSFGMSNSSVITASASYSQVSSVGLYALGNTTQNSSTTLDQRTLSFNALGAMTMGYSNGSIQVSAPATSSISGTGGISVAVNGSTISIGNAPLTRAIFPGPYMTAISAPGQGSASIQYAPTDLGITATRIDALVSWAAASSATTNTAAIALSAWAAIYTRNGSTLSSLSSGSTQTTYTYASNTAGNTQLITGAMRPVSVPVNVNMVPGEYFVAFNFSTNSSSVGLSTTNLAQTLSMMGANNLQTAANYAEFTNQTATSSNLFGGMGVYSAQTAGLPAAISLSAINQTGAALSQANIALVFRNV